MKGKKIEDLNALVEAANDKRSVVVPKTHAWERPKPAKVVLQLQGELLHRLFQWGMYLYDKPEKPKGSFNPKLKKREEEDVT